VTSGREGRRQVHASREVMLDGFSRSGRGKREREEQDER